MAPKKFYTIGEIAEFLDVPPSTLRYWEKQFNCLAPSRGMNGRRRYTEQDIETVRKLQFLVKDRGMKIDAARAELKKNPKVTDNTYRAVERLKDLKEKIREMIKAMDRLR